MPMTIFIRANRRAKVMAYQSKISLAAGGRMAKQQLNLALKATQKLRHLHRDHNNRISAEIL
jgi:hypothetical protein